MKYRRKGEIVEATYYSTYVWHGRGAHDNETWASGHYHVVDEAGGLHIYDQHRFEREFDRVEEEAKVRVNPYAVGRRCENTHCEVCTYCMTRESANCETSDGVTRYFCHECWAKRRAKKPKHFTIADTKPGDVFEFDYSGGVQTCQHMGMRTGELEYLSIFYTDAGGGEPHLRGWQRSNEHMAARKLRRLGHHDLTEKQRLWVDADRKMREALEKSISEKWLPIMRQEKAGRGPSDCPLCNAAYGCDTCLLHQGSLKGCHESGGWRHFFEFVAGYDSYRNARTFTLWLASFLPNIHPLRIEVEATPREWPCQARDKS